jgi:hypothetical protein
MINKSGSLSGPIVPRDADPNRTILSGLAARTTRFTMSARMTGSGSPFHFPDFGFPMDLIARIVNFLSISILLNFLKACSPARHFFAGEMAEFASQFQPVAAPQSFPA